MKATMRDGVTTYSEIAEGNDGNHRRAVCFDSTDGYVGITQKDGDAWRNRVLLSPAQVEALKAFLVKR